VSELYVNKGQSTLNGGITATATTLVVNSAAGFPSSGNFRIIIENELLLVTVVAGTTFTVQRGVENTTGVSHANGVNVTAIITAETLIQSRKEFHAFDSYANRPAAGMQGRIFQCNDIPFKYYDDGSNWSLLNPIIVNPLGPLTLSSWSWVNQGSAVATEYDGRLRFKAPRNTGNNWRLLTKALPTPPYTLTMGVWLMSISDSVQFFVTGFGIRESGTGKFTVIESENQNFLDVTNWNDVTSGSDIFRLDNNHGNTPIFFRIKDDNTNLIWGYSLDGLNFYDIATQVRTAHMASAGNQVCFGMNVTQSALDGWDWFFHYNEA
jgi:hypothetical protein